MSNDDEVRIAGCVCRAEGCIDEIACEDDVSVSACVISCFSFAWMIKSKRVLKIFTSKTYLEGEH